VNKRRLASPAAPALKYLDVDLQANPVGEVGVLVRVQDLVHPGDHDLLNELQRIAMTLTRMHATDTCLAVATP
jgi:hypothetical protein